MQYHRSIILTVLLIAISFMALLSPHPVVGKSGGRVTSSAFNGVPLGGGPPSGQVLWSCDFESGSMQSNGTGCFNAANPANLDVCPNSNNPGVVESAIVRSGKYAGYYYSNGSVPGALCRSYWNVQFGPGGKPVLPTVKTDDFYVEEWVYVPSINLTSWVSFMTVSFDPSGIPTINVDSDVALSSGRSIYIADHGFTNAGGSVYFRQPNPTPWPFDTWFKIGLELHLRPSGDPSRYTLYQNDVPVVSVTTNFDASYAALQNLHHLHFGLYMDGANNYFSVYNDDLVLEDLSGTSATSTAPIIPSTIPSGSNTTTVTNTITGTMTQTMTSVSTSAAMMTATPALTATSVPGSLGMAFIVVLLLAGATIWGLKRSKRPGAKHS